MANDIATDGKIVTFYSYKGGTGRTMALANVAWIMASNGLKVLVVDWDLDSPGLHKYFHPFLDSKLVAATPGVIELINDYLWVAAEQMDQPGDWRRQYARILPHAVSVNWEGFPRGGTLDYVSAGRQNRDYSSSLTSIDWDNFYDRLSGGQFIDALRDDMQAHYDYTLIDSRTGLSDIADICTVHLPDILVDCFTLNDQSIDGAAAVAKSVDQRYHYRSIRVLPVPMRIDEAEKDKADAGLDLARSRFDPFPKAMGEYERNEYWASVVIPYKPYYAFEETLAAFGDAPRSPLTLLGAYERLAAAITDGRVRSLGEMSEETRLTYKSAFIRPRQPPPGDIYLSYVPQDRMWADWIEALLTQRGIRVLRPPAGAVAGGRSHDEARRGAATAGRTVAILSAGYLASPDAEGVWEAIAAADPVGASRKLIPVRVADVTVGPPFSDRTIVDLTRRDETQATDELLKALGYPPKLTVQPRGASARPPRYPRTAPPVWRVPTRNAAFTGRAEVLEQLHDRLVGTSMAVVAPMALHGLGGVGKTQVALEYAHRYMADYDLIWWINAEQDELINPMLAPMAQSLGVRSRDSIPETSQAVREALRLGRPYDRWLLIFDNADNPEEVKEFFPGGPGHVIVTTRNPAWSTVAEPLEIDVFSREESLDLLRRRVPGLSVEDATRVAEALGDLPLAIEQAGAWLAETGMPAGEYVERLESQLSVTLDPGQRSDYPSTVAATWRLSFDRLREQSPGAARLLELCAYFSPDPISLSLLYSDEMIESLLPFDARLKERSVLAVLIRDLTRFSLAKIDRGNNTIEIHRLVQAVVRAQMPTSDYREVAMHGVHRILVGARPRQGGTDNPENWARYDIIWPHLSGSEAYNCDYEDTRRLLIDRVRYLWKRGEYGEALESGREFDQQWQRKIGPDHRQTLYLRFHIANVLRSQGRFEEAYELDQEILDKQRRSLGDGHPHTLQTAGSLAGDLRGLGKFYEALTMDEETYRQLKNTVGQDEPSTLSAANNLAVDLRLVGDFSRAREIDTETLADRQRVLGLDHPYTLHSAAMLGRDMRELGEYTDSIEITRATLDRYHAILGEDFVDTLRTAKSLAVSLRRTGRLTEAFQLSTQTNERYAGSYSMHLPEALACQLNLAADLSALDNKSAAYEAANKVLRIYEETLGNEHPFTLAARNNISTYLRGTGSIRTALDQADRTLTALRETLGDDHPFTLSCAVNRANCLHDLGRLEDAEAQLRDALDRLTKTLGARHPDTLICQANLAVCLRAAGKTEDALRVQQLVITEMREVLGEEHPNIVSLRDWRMQNRDLEVQPT
ncbi:MAG TPA: FxSxx-COOH system tetratricopeptide repeat protein [Trebonia sp.]